MHVPAACLPRGPAGGAAASRPAGSRGLAQPRGWGGSAPGGHLSERAGADRARADAERRLALPVGRGLAGPRIPSAGSRARHVPAAPRPPAAGRGGGDCGRGAGRPGPPGLAALRAPGLHCHRAEHPGELQVSEHRSRPGASRGLPGAAAKRAERCRYGALARRS